MINQQLVVHNGTHGGYVRLTERKADLCLLARRPAETDNTFPQPLQEPVDISFAGETAKMAFIEGMETAVSPPIVIEDDGVVACGAGDA